MKVFADTGSLVRVEVTSVRASGLQVQLKDGQTGLIREREIGWELKDERHWTEYFRPGETLEAVVLGKGHDGQLELSLRLAQNDPWTDLDQRLQPGRLVQGVVTGVQSYGAFIEIEPGVTGLLHESEVPSWVQSRVLDLFWPGDRVKVLVKEIDVAKRKLSLSLNAALHHRWHASNDVSVNASRLKANDRRQTFTAWELLAEQERAQSVLVVEDDQIQAEALADWLERAGQKPLKAWTGEAAVESLEQHVPDLVLMDLNLPGINGIGAIRQIHARWPHVRCVLVTDWAQADAHVKELRALQRDDVRLLTKPILPEELVDVLLDRSGDQPLKPTDELVDAEAMVSEDTLHTVPVADKTIDDLLARLRRHTSAAKAVLFALDPARRQVTVVAESGHGKLQQRALVELSHSPVRDVAEDEILVRTANAAAPNLEKQFRYLLPLLPFVSCIGVHVPAHLPSRYALFIFHSRFSAFSEIHEEYATATAIAIGALLEQQQFQAWMGESQRLALLGHLTRGLIHETNHQLSPISLMVDELEVRGKRLARVASRSADSLEAEISQTREKLALLTNAVRSLIATTQRFRQLILHGHVQAVWLNEIVEQATLLVSDMAKRMNVNLDLRPATRMFIVRAPLTQVLQVLLNILLNAVQQIELARGHAGGRVQVRFDMTRRDGAEVFRILVEDDGPGIHHSLWERIFEYGFTTRDEDGSGIGLYISRNLIEALGGRLYVADSYVLWGTTVVIELPGMDRRGSS